MVEQQSIFFAKYARLSVDIDLTYRLLDYGEERLSYIHLAIECSQK